MNLTQKRDGHPAARNPGVVGFEGPPDRGARGLGGRASAPLGAGQHEQLEAAFERQVEEEAAGAPQSARQVRQDEDRTAQTMSDIFGAPRVCSASVVAWVRNAA